MSGKLSSTEEIQAAVKFDTSEYSTVSALGSFINNNDFAKGFIDFQNGDTGTSRAFVYGVLSAVGDQIGETVYSNVKNYIDFVSNVDLCRVRALRSMFQMLGFDNTVLDCIDGLPLEIVNLLDILSIDKSRLLKTSILASGFMDHVAEEGTALAQSGLKLDLQRVFQHGVLQMSFSCPCAYDGDPTSQIRFKKIQSPFKQMSCHDRDTMLSQLDASKLSMLQNACGLSGGSLAKSFSAAYLNDYGYLVLQTSASTVVADQSMVPFIAMPSQIVDALSSEMASAEVHFEDLSSSTAQALCCDQTFISSKLSAGSFIEDDVLRMVYTNDAFTDDLAAIDDVGYDNLVADIFETLLSSILTIKYNADFTLHGKASGLYVYPHLGEQYYDQADYASDGLAADPYDEKIKTIKLLNHVQKSFNQRQIVNAIDAGDDSLENYSGAELSVLETEIDRRKSSLNLESLGLSETRSSSTNLNSTRYSYYREQKVLEYAKFIDNYFASILQSGNVYDYDPNYYKVNVGSIKSSVLTLRNGVDGADPSTDINAEMVSSVARYLAKLARYLSKLREKIKLQTRKNYMKGTNLLLIYIINEWLIDYSRHNSSKFLGDPETSAAFSTVFASLSNHQFTNTPGTYTIGIDENYDQTEYFNLSTATTPLAQLSSETSPRFWEQTTVENPEVLGGDGLQYTLAQIQNFYLSVLKLDQPLKDIDSNLTEFLSTLYDLGANDSFMHSTSDSRETLFSSRLSSGELATDLYPHLVSLSGNWDLFTQYLSGEQEYEWTAQPVEGQISSALNEKIYKDLSDQYLSGVSAVYYKHLSSVESLSSNIDQLSTDYTNFLTGDYSFYFKKFENSKCCYQDQDLENAIYLCPYYVGNPDVDNDDMTLHEHLYQLDKWCTSDNIKNWSLLCTVSYVRENVMSLSNELGQMTGSDDFQNKYGFVDINALTFDAELDYVYKFLDDNIASRKEFLQKQIDTVRSQVASCKTAYESLNNTFTAAVATFDDNHPGYKLGDSEVRWFSTYKDSKSELAKAKRQTKKPTDKKWDYVVYVPEAGIECWYYGKEDMKGEFLTDVTPITPYSQDDPLESRVAAVREYMNAPTLKTNDEDENEREIYGLMNDGIVAVCDNVESSLKDLELQYQTIADLAEEVLNVVVDGSAIGLYDRIVELNKAVANIDETVLDRDQTIKDYRNCIKQIISLSAQYLPVKQVFDSMFTDTEQSTYLFDMISQTDLTFENLDNLDRFRRRKDNSNLQTIKVKTREFLVDRFNQLVSQKDALEEAIVQDDVQLKTTSGVNIEMQVAQIQQALLDDVATKTQRANYQIWLIKQRVNSYVDIISTEVSASLSSMDDLDQCVSARLSSLNFFEDDVYKSYQKLFMTYGGRDFCWDPYYNIKNQTHPTYQVHPYLWNIVKKMDGQSLLESGFKSTVIDELEDMNFASNASKYFGSFGETINTWRAASNGLVDWSGYLSRYEKSSNMTASGVLNEVVDYDGLFYPPAVKQFSENPGRCIDTVKSKTTKTTVIASISQSMSSRSLSSFFSTTEEGIISGVEILQPDAMSQISSYIEVDQLSADLSEKFIGSSLSSVSKSSINLALDDAVPQTFYGKYYAHLQLPAAECQRVAEQLEEYGQVIVDELVAVQHYTNEHDIYKYGIDLNGNSYILLKKYDYSSISRRDQLTFQMKKNTLGELWIRLSGHPIAFPAFYGKHPVYFTKKRSRLNPSIVHLAELNGGIEYVDKDKQTIAEISDRMRWFYDFELTQNKSNLFLVSYNADLGLKHQEFWQQSEFAWVIPNVVAHYYDQSADIEYLSFSNTIGSDQSGYSTIKERIDFSSDSEYAFRDQVDANGAAVGLKWSLEPQEILKSGTRFPCLVGWFVDDMAAAEFVYLIKTFSNDGDGRIQASINQSPQIFVIKVKSGTSFRKTPSASKWTSIDLGSRVLTSGSACIGFDLESMQLTLAFTTRVASPTLSSQFSVSTSKSRIDLDTDTDGAVFDDPMASEMNSHDALVENVTLVDLTRSNGTLVQKRVHDHNFNADMSYLPSYPGLSNEMQIFSNDAIKKNDYYTIELLGMSRDLDYSEHLVNPTPNPYLDYDTIARDGMFGRVYEDYLADYDKTYKLVKAPALNDNMVKSVGRQLDLGVFSYDLSGRALGYTLAVHLDSLYDVVQYAERDYDNLQVLIYNSETLGKNPYAIAHLTSFLEEQELYYTKLDLSSSNEHQLDPEAVGSQNDVVVVGTRDALGTQSKIGSNYIRNISKISCKFSREQKLLTLTFMIEDPSTPTSIDEDLVNILLFNPNDLTQFKYYHLLDAYGAVNCRYISSFANPDQPDDGRGWGVVYDHSKFENDDLSSLIQSYYIDASSGDKKKKLADIQLSDYQALSDVYCLRGNKMLGFKYDEELHFAVSSDLYYFPSLNVSYPKTAADCISRMGITKQGEADLGYFQDIFNDHNLFVIALDSADDVAKSIGKVDIPVILDNSNDIRMYEDWLDDDLSSGLQNSQMVGITDPRALQFARFHDNGNDLSGISGPLEFEPSAFENVSLEDFIQNCQDLSNASTCKSEDYDPSKDQLGSSEKIQVDLSRGAEVCKDLQDLLRIHVSYKKDLDDHSITLYFNYFNYFDSPYIKIENQLLYSDTIQGTYLKLKAGENGILDIVLQLRYCIGDEIYGYRNVKALSYRIWNLSDDKPKFLIKKTYEIQRDSLAGEDIQSTLFISTPDVEVDLDQHSASGSKLAVTVPLDLASARVLSSQLEMTVLYPPDSIQMLSSESAGYQVEELDNEVGFAVLKLTNTTLNTYQLQFQTAQDEQDLGILQTQELALDIADVKAFDADGIPLDVEVDCGVVRFVKDSMQVLAAHPSSEVSEAKPQQAIIADMLSSLIIV